MKRSTTNILFIAFVLALPSGVAFADGQHNSQRLLRGDYRFNGTESCVDYSLFDGQTNNVYSSITGLINFDGNGNGVSTIKSMSVIDSTFIPPPFTTSTASLTCKFKYIVNPDDRSFRMQDGVCEGVVDSLDPDLPIRITGGESEGFVGQFKQILLVTAVEPGEQQTFFGFGEPPEFVHAANRQCTYAGTYMRARRASR